MRSQGELNPGALCWDGRVIGKGEMDGLGARRSGRRILHRFQCLVKGRVAEVDFAIVAIDAI